jgi:zinc protease
MRYISWNKVCSIFFLFLVISGAGGFLFTSFGWSQDSSFCLSTDWPHEKSDLKPDPAVLFGKLDNGFRYTIMENSNPRDRVAIYLAVNAGSLHEQEDQRGYAHFVEHMLFTGSTHFPPGTLIEYFQDIGMGFGADTNAYTSFDQTVYIIVLPKGDVAELEKGLLVISDYARGALLLESEVDRERGVILAEKIARDSVDYRTRVAARKDALEGTLFAEREPIGVLETLTTADGKSLRSFYDAWYRPENMTLVVVGDINKKQVEKMLVERFSSMKGAGEPPACPDIGQLKDKGKYAFYYREPDAGNVTISIESYWNKEQENDSSAFQISSLKRYIATKLVENRLLKIAEETSGILRKPRVYHGTLLDRIGYSGLSATTTENTWQESLAVLENSLRQALQYGFSDTELDRVKKEVVSYYNSQIEKAAGRESTTLVRQIIGSIHSNRVFQSPEQERDLFVPAMNSLTVAEIEQYLSQLFERRDRRIAVTGNVDIKSENPEKYIVTIYNAMEDQPVQPYIAQEKKIFPYLELSGEPVLPEQRVHHAPIDVETYTYSNGVALHLKKTDFKPNQTEIFIEFGPGQQTEPHPGLAKLAESVIMESGTERLTVSELKESLADSTIDFDFKIDATRFLYTGKALSTEAELLVQTLFTLFKDPALRQTAYENVMLRYEQMHQAMQNDIHGADSLHVQRFFAGGNHLFGMPAWEDMATIKLKDIEGWIMPVFQDAAPHISVVGDFDKNEILSLVNTYFGSLPQRKNYSPQEERVDFPAGEELQVPLDSELDKSLIVLGWKTEGFVDIGVVRRLGMLGSIFEERVRLSVREKLGAVYSPSVYNSSSRFIKDFGVMYVRIVVDAAYIETVKEAVLQTAADLYADGVTEEELERVRKPLLTLLKDRIRTNSYWLRTVLYQASIYPEQLLWPTTIIEDNESIQPEEMTAYAAKYLEPEKAAVAVVRPR